MDGGQEADTFLSRINLGQVVVDGVHEADTSQSCVELGHKLGRRPGGGNLPASRQAWPPLRRLPCWPPHGPRCGCALPAIPAPLVAAAVLTGQRPADGLCCCLSPVWCCLQDGMEGLLLHVKLRRWATATGAPTVTRMMCYRLWFTTSEASNMEKNKWKWPILYFSVCKGGYA